MKGTKGFMAPEVLKREGYNSNVDVFSTGIMVYEALFGVIPWYA